MSNKEPFEHVEYDNGVHCLHVTEFEKFGGIKAFFTTKLGGVSTESYETMNMGGYTEDSPENVKENRRKLYEAVGIIDSKRVFVKQVHEDYVRSINEEDIPAEDGAPVGEADGLMTDKKNTLLMTLHADCVPLFFFDTVKRIVAVSHAGWRGTAKRIGPKTIKRMEEAYGSKPEDIIAAVGPGIGLCCFEVGPEVYEEFGRCFDRIDECAVRKDNGKYMLDLKKINGMMLEEAGASKVLVSGYCTYCNDDIFYSYRRDGGKTGRMGAGIILIND